MRVKVKSQKICYEGVESRPWLDCDWKCRESI